jgi:hypothetical protein
MNKLERTPHAKPGNVFLELSFGEQILLWGIRIWVSGYRNDINFQNMLRLAYAHAGVPRAHIELNNMMEMITIAGLGVMDVRCPSCIKVSDDEILLMSAIAAWQHGSSPYAGDIYLEPWAKPASLRILRPIAQKLATILREGGVLIRPRP